MPQFTPITTKDLNAQTDTIRVHWPSFNSAGQEEIDQQFHVVAETADYTSYNTSFVYCKHPDGKIWKSLFVPLEGNGSKGVSLTWWGKDESVKGQCQAKVVSEKEWYTVFKSKVGKDYDVTQYIGRYVPVDSNHQFVYNLAGDNEIAKLPALAFEMNQSRDLIHTGGKHRAGTVIGKAIAEEVLPIAEFIISLQNKKVEPRAQIEACADNQGDRDFIDGLTDMMFGTGKVVSPSAVRAPVPVIDREEVYGSGWGGFA